MLRLSPRTITAAVLLIFCTMIGLRHLAFIFGNPYSSTAGRYLISLMLESGRQKGEAIDSLKEKAKSLGAMPPVLAWLERVDYDFHLRSHKPGAVHPDVTIVEVNEKSLRELGQFPFSRSVYKTLIQKLELAGAKVVAFDITFPEEERSALKQIQLMQQELTLREGFDAPSVRYLSEKVNALDVDEALANALSVSKIPVILGYAFSDAFKAQDDKSVADNDARARKIFANYDIKTLGVEEIRDGKRFTSLESETDHIPIISIDKLVGSLTNASSIGNFAVTPDVDGLIRRVPVVVQYDNYVLGSLGLRAIASYFGEEPMLDMRGDGLAIRGMKMEADGSAAEGKMNFPILPNGEVYLRFYYEEGRDLFPYTEFSDIVTGALSEEALKKSFAGKMVFVGVTAHGLKDIRGTPYTSVFPGVESHATLASNVLTQHFLQKSTVYYWVGYLFTILCSLFVSFVVYRFHPAVSFGATVAMGALLHGLTVYSFNNGMVIPSLLPVFSGITIFVTGVVYRYMTEERERKKVRSVLSRYVSAGVVEDILKDQTKLRLGGQKKELTVMFVDLVGFTKIAEHMDAALVTQLLNEYFTRMTNVIFKHHGTLDKFMGDSIMCFWGAPHDTPEHAHLACLAALEIQHELARINHDWRGKHGITLENRIGVHTGVMAVGNMGSNEIFSYTVMGDNVNLGSRLEGVNTVYGTHVIVSAATAEKAGKDFLFRPLDRVQVKGKEDAVDILELVEERGEKEPEWVHAFRTGLKHFQAGEWDDAESAFGACLSLKPGDGPAQVFVDRIRDFRIVEPEDWRGVWKLASK